MSKFITYYFEEGRQAYREGKLIDEDNFYIKDSAAYWSWHAGFVEEWFNDKYGENK